jgi:aldehyde:ferredoxin oxidoreductase
MDYPPGRWFDEGLSEGDWKGSRLNREKYDLMLQAYYSQRGWDADGVPTMETLEKIDLSDVAEQLSGSK